MAKQLLTEASEKAKINEAYRGSNPGFAQSYQRGVQPISQLQRTLGNREIARLIQTKQLSPSGEIMGLQRKLTVGATDDQYEQEADQVARQVMSMPDAAVANPVQRSASPEDDQENMVQTKPLAASITPFVQRQPEAVEEEEVPIQGKSAESMSGSFEAGDDVESQISQSKGRGSPLPDPVRTYMEPRFGVDFSGVRVHTGSDAVQMNRAVGAQAFTHGSDVYFGEGRSPNNLELTAHELTHVVQQTGGGIQSKSIESNPVDSAADSIMRATGTRIPTPFLGGSPFNDSAVTFRPRGEMWVEGVKTSEAAFSGSAKTDTVQIAAGKSGKVQLHTGVHAFEDNLLINDSWDQNFYVEWYVSTASDGTLTIDSSPSPQVSPANSSNNQGALQSVNPNQGANHVQVSPIVASGGGSGGISLGVGLTGNYPGKFIKPTFKLNIEVTGIQEPEVDVSFGPIKMQENHNVFFARPGQDDVSGNEESSLVRWYEGLTDVTKEKIQNGSEPISLVGYASTTGDSSRNRELSDRRTQNVRTILSQFAGNRALINTRSIGEYQAETEDEVESQGERKVAVSVWDTISEAESGFSE